MDIANIVVSLAGRDKDELFVIIKIEDGYALIADGKSRRIVKPKRKKLKHLRFVGQCDEKLAEKLRAGDKILDSEIRRAVSELTAQCKSQYQGGNKAWQKTM